jgi:nucleotide-binding universal stress UspA family protein
MDTAEGRVVVGVSTSLAGIAALRFGVGEAIRRKAPLIAVRAGYLNASMRGPEMRQWRDEMAADAVRTVHYAFDDAMGAVPPEVAITMVTVENRADLALLAVADRTSDLLVLGGRSRRLMSWIVKHCLRKAGCTVVVVPPPELARTASRRAAVRVLLRDAEQYTSRT